MLQYPALFRSKIQATCTLQQRLFHLTWPVAAASWLVLFSSTLSGATVDENWDARFGPPPGLAGAGILEGANGPINAIVMNGSDVYVGGRFTHIGDVDANNVARWDGQRWHTLGNGSSNGVNGEVHALAYYNCLIVGGLFSAAGDGIASNIAQWTDLTDSWQEIGGGCNGRVRALARHYRSGIIYAGGDFTTAGYDAHSARHVARWNFDDSSAGWEGLSEPDQINPEGVNDTVEALFCDDSGWLYAGGRFTQAGDNSANHIARWRDSIGWEKLLGAGSQDGVNGFVYALAKLTGSKVGFELAVGGIFSHASAVASGSVAIWTPSEFSTENFGQ